MARQEITIGNETFEADVEMIPLLNELHNVGLRTTQHCIGHEGEGDGTAYLSIAIQPDMDIGIRYDERPRLTIRWNRSASHNTASTQLIAGLISVVQKYGWDSKESLDYYYEHLREAINSAHC